MGGGTLREVLAGIMVEELHLGGLCLGRPHKAASPKALG